jgi:hypothetical protein
MKIKFLFLPLALLVAETSLAQSNPSSPNSQSAAAAVTASGVFISSYQENDQEDYYFPPFTNSAGYVFPSDSYSDINFTHWADGKGGDGQWQFHDDSGVQWSYAWPATAFPQALPYGTGVEIYLDYPEIPPYTNACHSPTLAQEHCNFSVGKSPFVPIHMQRTADTKMKLATGGAAGSTKMNLWVISATATAYSLPWAIGGAGGGWASALTGTPIASQNISLFGKTLGNDGNLYVLLPDNATPDATPIVTGGGDFYSFTLSAQKCRLNIFANDYLLADNRVRPQAYYCVGQKLNFQGVFSPSPSGLNYTSPIWNYSADYVNNHWTDINNCEEYNIAPIPAMSNPTVAWFYNKQTQDATATLGLYCKFNNGQSVYLVRQGKFNVYTPEVIEFTNSPPYYATLDTNRFNIHGSPWLSDGGASGGSMDFSAKIKNDSKFSGHARWTQLINSYRNRDETYPLGSYTWSTGGNYWLDNQEFYFPEFDDVTINPHSTSSSLSFGDGPEWPCGLTVCTINDQFKTYLRFRPDGDADNIWVTLKRVDWEWHATAALSGAWAITSQYTPLAQLHDDNTFPIWSNNVTSFGQ